MDQSAGMGQRRVSLCLCPCPLDSTGLLSSIATVASGWAHWEAWPGMRADNSRRAPGWSMPPSAGPFCVSSRISKVTFGWERITGWFGCVMTFSGSSGRLKGCPATNRAPFARTAQGGYGLAFSTGACSCFPEARRLRKCPRVAFSQFVKPARETFWLPAETACRDSGEGSFRPSRCPIR